MKEYQLSFYLIILEIYFSLNQLLKFEVFILQESYMLAKFVLATISFSNFNC